LVGRRLEEEWYQAVHSAQNNRKKKRYYSKQLYKQRHKIEIMFGRIQDWHRIAICYDRGAHTFFSAICIAATVICYLKG
jgi:transposase